MSRRPELFGLYTPGRSIIHRLPVGVKFALMLVVSMASLMVRHPWFSLVMLAAMVGLLLLTGLGVRRCLRLPLALWIMVAMLAGYQLIWGTIATTVTIVANLILCVYASRVLTLTTPAPVLLDALVTAARPLRWVGGDPERVGLAAALMLRSIPFLLGSYADVWAAARARGLERNVLAQVIPIVIGAVAYALATGEALAARGLGEGE